MHRWVEHTSELELQIEAPTEAALFVDALTGLAEVLGEPAGAAPTRREVTASAPDSPALLAAWLEEIVFLAESEGFIAEDVVALSLEHGAVRSTVEGGPGRPSHLVKAITYHRLELGPAENGWRARVVLDV